MDPETLQAKTEEAKEKLVESNENSEKIDEKTPTEKEDSKEEKKESSESGDQNKDDYALSKRRLSQPQGSVKKQRTWGSKSSDAPQSVKTENLSRVISSDELDKMDTEKRIDEEKATNTILIRGFIRPFTNNAIKEYLSKDGEYSFFWMDSIKTHCYVTYSSPEVALATLKRIDEVVWPPVTGKVLYGSFLEEEKAKERIEQEENKSKNLFGTSKRTVTQVARQETPKANASIEDTEVKTTKEKEQRVVTRQVEKVQETPKEKKKTLDELFKKTATKPVLYYLPLTEEQVQEKLKEREQRKKDLEKRRNERSGQKVDREKESEKLDSKEEKKIEDKEKNSPNGDSSNKEEKKDSNMEDEEAKKQN